MIRLTEDYDHQLKVGSARQVLAAYPDPVVMGSDFVERYRSLYGERLDPKELHTILHGLAEVGALSAALCSHTQVVRCGWSGVRTPVGSNQWLMVGCWEFHILGISTVMSGWTPTCDRAHSW